MGKSYKKRQRAEKAKVKLKSTKLPKGLNVTKTEFKVRKIIIREQLKESQVVEGQRLHDLKELNTRLKHHNHNYRQEALVKLRETIIVRHQRLPTHLNELMQSISSLCLDQERSVRQESFRVLSVLLDYLTPERTAPFFHILSSYLRCGMTHIHVAIQEDALLMLDTLLRHVPDLVAADSTRILQNFLEMISRARNEGKISSTTTNSGTTGGNALNFSAPSSRSLLTLPVSQKQTTIKWRSRVLIRLQEMLRTLVSYRRQQLQTNREQQRDTSTTVTFQENKAQYFNLLPLYPEFKHGNILVENICCPYINTINDTINGEQKENTDTVPGMANCSNYTKELYSYINHLMPLLMESWLEVRPKGRNHCQPNNKVVAVEGVHPLNPDATCTLSIILEIMEHLWSLIDLHESVQLSGNDKELSRWFQDTYQESFANNFVQSLFPYRRNGQQTVTVSNNRAESRHKKGKTQSSQNCLIQNISVCYLTCRFFALADNAQPYDRDVNRLFTGVFQYLEKILLSSSVTFHQSLMQTLEILLLKNGKYFLQQLPDETISLLQNLHKILLKRPTEGQQQISVLHSKMSTLLCEILLNRDLYEMFGGVEEFEGFIQYLPTLLLQNSVHETTIKALTQLSKQQQPVFLMALSNHILKVLENLQTVQIVGSTNILESKKNVINLIYWIKVGQQKIANGNEQQTSQNNIDFMELFEKVHNLYTDTRLIDYLKYISRLS